MGDGGSAGKLRELMTPEAGFGRETGREKRFGFSKLENGKEQDSGDVGMRDL